MKNKFLKFITALICAITVAFSLTGCISLDASGGKQLSAPQISVDESKEIVYWNSVSGSNRYNVNLNGEVSTVSTTFFDCSTLPVGVYELKVKALPYLVGDTSSAWSNEVKFSITDDAPENDGGDGSTGGGSTGDGSISDGIDYVGLINGVSQEVMQANFTVFLTMKYVNQFGFASASARSQGSGIIYKKLNSGTVHAPKTTYYLLTNNHVIYKDTVNYNTFTYTVTDIFNNEYQAELIANDPSYDLAVLKFTIEQTETSKSYTPLTLASSNLSTNDKVISLGQPKGQKNTLTLGSVVGFATPTITVDPNTEMSNVEFSVYRHNAPITSGSSGGALLDYNYNIVGINYASSTDSSGNYLYSFAVPILKVKEFLNLYNLPY